MSKHVLAPLSPLLSSHGPFAECGLLAPIPSLLNSRSQTRTVAPISTVLFVPRDHVPSTPIDGMPTVPAESNLEKGKHWTDTAPPGSVVLMQQPRDQIVGLVGDIVATRYKVRGIRGCFVDGRVRDISGIAAIASESKGSFTCWSRALTSVGTSLEAKPWTVDAPVKIGAVEVQAGDIMVADEAEGVCCVIPRGRLEEVMELLPVHKEADDGLLGDVRGGMGFGEAIKRWPKHYSNH